MRTTSGLLLAVHVAAFAVLPSLATAADPPAVRDPETADRLAKCSAAYVTQYRILEAGGKKMDRLAAASERTYDAAMARSDERHTKARFTEHYKAYLALNKEVTKAAAGEERAAAAAKFTATLNADMEQCEALEKRLDPPPRRD